MRTKLIREISNDIIAEFNSGKSIHKEYECPCGKGKILEIHNIIPGFNSNDIYNDVQIECDECSENYELDISKGIYNWEIKPKKIIDVKKYIDANKLISDMCKSDTIKDPDYPYHKAVSYMISNINNMEAENNKFKKQVEILKTKILDYANYNTGEIKIDDIIKFIDETLNIPESNDYNYLCWNCRKITPALIKSRNIKRINNNKEYEYIEKYAICANCEMEITVPGLLDDNEKLFHNILNNDKS